MIVRIPTQYSLHRSNTGRIVSSISSDDDEPGRRKKKGQNLHNFPHELRDAFRGNFVGGDWAGIDWAMTMHFCAELNTPRGFHEDLLRRFRAGDFDPHTHLASVAYGCAPSDVTREQRQSVKPFTHGRTYRGSPQELGKRAQITPERSLAYAEANHIIEGPRCLRCRSTPKDMPLHIRNKHAGFRREIFQLICDAHEEAFRLAAWQKDTYTDCKRRHFIETPLGWRRYFWGYEPKLTDALGWRPQATAADLLKWTMRRMLEVRMPGVNIITTTHDSFLLEVTDGTLATTAVATALKHDMEAPVPWLGGRSFRADVKIGAHWGEC